MAVGPRFAALVLVAMLDVLLLSVSRDPDDAYQGIALPLLFLTLAAALAPFLCIRSERVFSRVTFVTSSVLLLCSFALYYAGVVTLVAAALHCAAAVCAARRGGRLAQKPDDSATVG